MKLTQGEESIIKKYLTITNPLFNQRIGLGLQNWNIPQHLFYYKKISNKILIPIGALPEIVDLIEKQYPTAEFNIIQDNRTSNIDTNYFSNVIFTGNLRDYQLDIVNACLNNIIGIIEAATGSGKTICFINLIIKRKIPTLILVNTVELANQTIDKLIQFSNLCREQIGLIGNGVKEIKPITVALHQSLSTIEGEELENINNIFGQVIADEVHICAANTYFDNMNKLRAKYKYGFSATPQRDDGLTPVIHFCTGAKIHIVPNNKLVDSVLPIEVHTIDTNFQYLLFSTTEYQNMLTSLAIDKNRNELIKNTLIEKYKDKYICLLCNRVDQVKELNKLLGSDSIYITSEMNKRERKEAMELINTKKIKWIISTYGLFSTGIDIPWLEVIFFCSPMKSTIKIKQAIGRARRPYPGKTKAIIVDFVDKRNEILYVHFKKRLKIYNQLINNN